MHILFLFWLIFSVFFIIFLQHGSKFPSCHSIISHSHQTLLSYPKFEFKYYFVESEEKGSLSWKFDFTESNKSLQTVVVQTDQKTYETGIVNVRICTNDNCVILPKGKKIWC